MKIIGNINLNSKRMYIWKVYGVNGHRLRNSFNESYFQSMEENEFLPEIDRSKYNRHIIVGELNNDVLNTHYYNLFIIFAENEESALEELKGQLSDGAYENAQIGAIERIL